MMAQAIGFGVREESPIIRTTTLPSDAARAATQRAVAVIAGPVVETAGADQQRAHHTEEQYCALHVRHPLRNLESDRGPIWGVPGASNAGVLKAPVEKTTPTQSVIGTFRFASLLVTM